MPELIQSVAAIREHISHWKNAGLSIGFVPTMGALHAGHGALIQRAQSECDRVVVSIFVNPIQFDDQRDFERYARNLDQDLAFCRSHHVDVVFAPSMQEMYPVPQRSFVDVAGVSDNLCGPLRPGHFRGVATVVTKLFNIVGANKAYFGQKDAQQVAVIRALVADLNIPVTVVPVQTIRDPDGLAMSSRNLRLTADERRIAPLVYRALQVAADCVQSGISQTSEIRAAGLQVLNAEPTFRVEYFEVVAAESMQPIALVDGPICIATAVWLGSTRLIDNVLLP